MSKHGKQVRSSFCFTKLPNADHRPGFDQEGAAQLKYKLRRTNKWIGTAGAYSFHVPTRSISYTCRVACRFQLSRHSLASSGFRTTAHEFQHSRSDNPTIFELCSSTHHPVLFLQTRNRCLIGFARTLILLSPGLGKARVRSFRLIRCRSCCSMMAIRGRSLGTRSRRVDRRICSCLTLRRMSYPFSRLLSV